LLFIKPIFILFYHLSYIIFDYISHFWNVQKAASETLSNFFNTKMGPKVHLNDQPHFNIHPDDLSVPSFDVENDSVKSERILKNFDFKLSPDIHSQGSPLKSFDNNKITE